MCECIPHNEKQLEGNLHCFQYKDLQQSLKELVNIYFVLESRRKNCQDYNGSTDLF